MEGSQVYLEAKEGIVSHQPAQMSLFMSKELQTVEMSKN